MPSSPEIRVRSKTALADAEKTMTGHARAAVDAYLELVRHHVLRGRGFTAAAGIPDSDDDSDDDVLADLNGLDMTGAWGGIVDEYLIPGIDTVLNGVTANIPTSSSVVSDAVRAFRAQWLADRRQQLAGVAADITRQLRDEISADMTANGPDPRAASKLAATLLSDDNPSWDARAQTIGRTETLSATNQGGLAAWGAVHDSLTATGAQVLKTWVATEDAVTRPDHADVDGTEIGMGETFDVGGSPMTGPGDPDADPGETINCRCTLTYRVVDANGDDAGDLDTGDSPDGDADTDAMGDDALTAATGDTMTAPAPVAPTTVEQVAEKPPVVSWSGVLAPVDTPSADGRMILSAGLLIRQLPLPLSFQAESSHGGQEAGTSVVVGRILTAEIADGGIQATGDFLDPDADFTSGDAIRAAVNRINADLGMVSVDVAPIVVSYGVKGPDGTVTAVDPALLDADGGELVMIAAESELMGVTLVADAAFGTARISLVTQPVIPPEDNVNSALTADSGSPTGPVVTADGVTFPDGTELKIGDPVHIVGAMGADTPTEGTLQSVDVDNQEVTVSFPDPDTGEAQTITVAAANLETSDGPAPTKDKDETGDDPTDGALTASVQLRAFIPALTAAGAYAQDVYNREWFKPVALDGPTRLTITEEGRVYGHVAKWGECHIGFPGQCVTPPSSPSGYARFHLSDIHTDEGTIGAGKLTVGGGHADLKYGFRAAAEHYDDSCAAVAMVRAHEDDFGIQVTGQVIPGTPPARVNELRRSPLSGDWRGVGGNREMVAALGVNTPGFGIQGPKQGFAADGTQISLVAAGMIPVNDETTPEPVTAPGTIVLPSGARVTADDVALVAAGIMRLNDIDNTAKQKHALESEAVRLRLALTA